MALTMEARCLEFYQEMAKRNQDTGGKEVFEKLTGEAEKHITELNAKLDEIVRQEKDLDRAPVFLHFDPCVLEGIIPDLSKYETGGEFRLDAKVSTELALSLNRSASNFFKSYAGKFAETQGKQIFLNFADQEGNHCEFIRQRPEGMST
jgi:rubrerythrin